MSGSTWTRPICRSEAVAILDKAEKNIWVRIDRGTNKLGAGLAAHEIHHLLGSLAIIQRIRHEVPEDCPEAFPW